MSLQINFENREEKIIRCDISILYTFTACSSPSSPLNQTQDSPPLVSEELLVTVKSFQTLLFYLELFLFPSIPVLLQKLCLFLHLN